MKNLNIVFIVFVIAFLINNSVFAQNGNYTNLTVTNNTTTNNLTLGKYGSPYAGDNDPFKIHSPLNSGTHDLMIYGTASNATLNLRMEDGDIKMGPYTTPNAIIRNSGSATFSDLTLGKYGSPHVGDSDPFKIHSPLNSGTHDLMIYGTASNATLNLRMLDGDIKMGGYATPNAIIRNSGSATFSDLTLGKYGSPYAGDSDPFKIHSPLNSGTHDLMIYGTASNATLNLRMEDGDIKMGPYTTPNAIIRNNGSADFNKVTIGNISTPGNYNLYVENGILTEKVKVALYGTSDWADYVFQSNYKLRTLEEKAAFIQKNGHLPNFQSATTYYQDGGIELKDITIKQQEVLEENTLHLIDHQQAIQNLQQENTQLKQINQQLQEQNKALEERLEAIERLLNIHE